MPGSRGTASGGRQTCSKATIAVMGASFPRHYKSEREGGKSPRPSLNSPTCPVQTTESRTRLHVHGHEETTIKAINKTYSNPSINHPQDKMPATLVKCPVCGIVYASTQPGCPYASCHYSMHSPPPTKPAPKRKPDMGTKSLC
ncbi:hypothetical protein JDV02_008309 [Purpureocillium takamizusanense]|uniref:Uncharacterized protein n=1 Tax=Purpureocillium takamizusanense TaxID=2060973 RepID=A0A9Q8QMH7_9HYPO|nr:uncharacterized protein JDV02_008309 [Purpureocillium takamizusanense]UNI22418.1 hypothetical protein JDV02_008309 [Purpureocillium takamizusanense]